MIEFIDRSIHIKDTVLWLDAVRETDLSFISHPHPTKRKAIHKRIIASKETVEFYKKFLSKGRPINALQMPNFKKFSIGDLNLILYPSGYLPGSAQILIQKNGKKILYSGYINNNGDKFSEELYYPQTDILIVETTYANPSYIFPHRSTEEKRLVEYIYKNIEMGYHVVILSRPLGIPQYLINSFKKSNITPYLHKTVYQYTNFFKDQGYPIDNFKSLTRKPKDPSIIFYPLDQTSKIPLDKYSYKLIGISGEAVFKDSFNKKYNLDDSFVISRHADFNGLLDYIKIVKPSKIYLLPGELKEFKNILKDMKFNCEELITPKQKPLF